MQELDSDPREMRPVASIPISSMAETIKKSDDCERNYDRDGDRDVLENCHPPLRFANCIPTFSPKLSAH
jgi:hypothetical protein